MCCKKTGAYRPIKIDHGPKPSVFPQITPAELDYTIRITQ